VKSLRALLDSAPGQHPVHRRAESSFPVLAITEGTTDPVDIETWWRDALHELRAAADDHAMQSPGPPAASTTNAFSNTNPVRPSSSSPSPRHANWAESNPWLSPPPRWQDHALRIAR
jgi:hypothetical protein